MPKQNDPFESGGFINAIKHLLQICLTAILAQNIYVWTVQSSMGGWIGIIGAGAILAVYVLAFGRSLFRIIDTPYFAVSGLLFMALGTALGTFVIQNTIPEVFTQRYGETGSRILRFFQLDDVFHSWWYISFLILISISLIKISARKSFTRANLGFYLAHLGPILVFAGFIWDFYAGFRGLIQLETGMNTDLVSVYQPNTNRIRDSLHLDFRVQLDDFASERYDPDHRIQVWEKSPESSPQIVASMPPELNRSWKIYNTDISFQVVEFYPNFYLKYSYPENTDTIEAKDPGMLLELSTVHGKDMLQMMSNVEGRNIFDMQGIGASLEFYWELPAEIESALSNYSSGSAWAQKNRIVFIGSQGLMYQSINGELSETPIEIERYYPIPGKENTGFTVFSIFPDFAYLSSQPTSLNDKQENPVARLKLFSASWEGSQEAFLYPGESGPGGRFSIPGTPYFLVLESFRDRETKYWRSDLSILDATGTVKKQESIKVNEPLHYKGYRLYQTDYDPNNPRYSGIGVNYSPGLYLVYFGFVVLTLGVLMLFYIRYNKGL